MRELMLAALLSLAASPALAFYDTGDNVVGLKLGGLQLAKTAHVSLAEETLTISPRQVHADYIFRNTGDLPVTTLVVFQLPDIEGPYTNIDAGDTSKDNFLSYKASQDGVAVKPALQRRAYSTGIDVTALLSAAKVPLNPLSQAALDALKKLPQATLDDWLIQGLIVEDTSEAGKDGKKVFAPAWTMKSTYSWKASFPPGKDVHISETHDNSTSSSVAIGLQADAPADDATQKSYRDDYCVTDTFVKEATKVNDSSSEYNGSWTSYKLRGVDEWLPTIGKFTLVVEKTEATSLVSFCGANIKQTGPTTYETTVTDYTPDKDINILYFDRAEAP